MRNPLAALRTEVLLARVAQATKANGDRRERERLRFHFVNPFEVCALMFCVDSCVPN